MIHPGGDCFHLLASQWLAINGESGTCRTCVCVCVCVPVCVPWGVPGGWFHL